MGEAVARSARPRARPVPLRTHLPEGTLRRLIVVSLAVGSNLPDADLLYTSLAGGPLAYILHHRGYTHTVPVALLGAALLWLTCVLWLRYRQLRATAHEHAWIAGAAVAGVLLHLAMDYTNSYGVHPFWPFYDGWLYGDSVFIVEPLMWLAAAPLMFLLQSRTARVLVGMAVALGIVAVTLFGFVATPAVVVFVALAAAMLAAGVWLQPPVALACGIALWLSVTVTFAVAGRLAERQLAVQAARQFGAARTLDQILTPTPSDPVCWDAWLVQLQGRSEIMRQARISIWPQLIPVTHCQGVDRVAARSLTNRAVAVPMASGEAVPAVNSAALQWQQQFSLPVDRIARLAQGQCRVRAFMQFARVPMAQDSASRGWLEDLRFGDGRGFARLQLSHPPQACDFPAVPWLPPRPELLHPSESLP